MGEARVSGLHGHGKGGGGLGFTFLGAGVRAVGEVFLVILTRAPGPSCSSPVPPVEGSPPANAKLKGLLHQRGTGFSHAETCFGSVRKG